MTWTNPDGNVRPGVLAQHNTSKQRTLFPDAARATARACFMSGSTFLPLARALPEICGRSLASPASSASCSYPVTCKALLSRPPRAVGSATSTHSSCTWRQQRPVGGPSGILRGISARAWSSSNTSADSIRAPRRVAAQFHSSGRQNKVMASLQANDDLFGGVIVDPEALPSDPQAFADSLSLSLAGWKEGGKRGVWLEIPTSKAALVGPAVNKGFEFHHAEQGYVMLTTWLAPTPSTLPPNASHRVGVGSLVLNDKDEMLVVMERMGPAARPGFWKMPTGLVEQGEAIADAATREVLEETGVHAELSSVIGFREVHGTGMGRKSDLFFVCACRALSNKIEIQESEIADAKWMPVKEYLAGDHVKGSLYRQMTVWGLQHFEGKYNGMKVDEMEVGFRPGTNLVYHMEHHHHVSPQVEGPVVPKQAAL